MNKADFIKLLEDTNIPEDCTDATDYLMPIAEALMKIIPTQLFRFRTVNEYSLSAFDKDLIFFSRAKDFNDPYDTLITSSSFEAIRQCTPETLFAVMTAMRDQLLKEVEIPDEIKSVFPKDVLDQLLNFLRIHTEDMKSSKEGQAELNQIFTNLKESVSDFETGLQDSESYACFSEAITSPTMWAHYADYHKGFALSYDLKSLILSRPNGVMLFPIIYSSKRHDSTNMLGWCIGQKFGLPMTRIDRLDKIKCSLYKSLDWEYEKEWRLINSVDQVNAHPSLEYAPTGIYYGSKISEINKKILHSIAVEKGLKEYEMYIDRGSSNYDMKIRPISIK